MACSASPEPDRFHRYKLASHGLAFETVCAYCGTPKTLRPFAAEDALHVYRRAVQRPSRVARRDGAL